MSSFTEPLTVTKVIEQTKKKFLWLFPYTSTKMYWVTARAFRYYLLEDNSDLYIDVPEGTRTDFASVPRWLWWLFPPDGIYTQAAVLHDFLYTSHLFTREESDNIFLGAMTVLGVDEFTRNTMYYFVRKFGETAWNKKQE